MTNSRVLVLGDGIVAREMARELAGSGLLVTSFAADEPLFVWKGDGLHAVRELMQTVEVRTFDTVVLAFASERETVREIVREVERRMAPDALLLIAALGLSVTEAASWCALPERVAGFGYVPPLAGVACLEAAQGLQTSAETAERAGRFLQAGLGREAVWVKDSAGLVMPRVVAMVINEAAYALMEGIATEADLDTAMRLGTNYPHGPLEWADQIGVEQVVAVLQGVFAEQGDDRYRPAPLLQRMAKAGRRFYPIQGEAADDADARGGHY
ncbi:3-hydroxybutyryl-CoA dehydrogenase [Tumebacillus sp. BK434]|uniref:3-hydroxyacyl-CoA dehydrogenase family protein n=1 Tax=Tumebacillus sp. BK434 TaxID=2512169 RepID=UPI00104F64A9|nr:3-hydroxyacyl-CoA dehydrogenase family protein [Tumebacillus sp. BK434]TCP56048.1 3-hydroxybutyryl-CoA dehydrogenase [Tumebacillus sp. BK434]